MDDVRGRDELEGRGSENLNVVLQGGTKARNVIMQSCDLINK